MPSPRPPADPATLLARFAAWEQARSAEGLGYVTTRRITEELALTPPEAADLYRVLRTETPPRRVPPLWRLAGT